MLVPRWTIITFVVLALLGFSDASFLTAEHVRGVIPPCNVVSGCEQVLSSKYATILGVPVSGLGMAYYGTLLVLLFAYIDTKSPKVLRITGFMTITGLLASLYFMYVQIFLISAYCLYCLASALISVLLFAIGVYTLRLGKNSNQLG